MVVILALELAAMYGPTLLLDLRAEPPPQASGTVVEGSFGFDGNIFTCVDLETGKRRWKRGLVRNGSEAAGFDLGSRSGEAGRARKTASSRRAATSRAGGRKRSGAV